MLSILVLVYKVWEKSRDRVIHIRSDCIPYIIEYNVINTILDFKMVLNYTKFEIFNLIIIELLLFLGLNSVGESKSLSIRPRGVEDLKSKSMKINSSGNIEQIYINDLSGKNTSTAMLPKSINQSTFSDQTLNISGYEPNMLIDSIAPDDLKVATVDDLKFASDDLLTLDRSGEMFIKVNITVMTGTNLTRYCSV